MRPRLRSGRCRGARNRRRTACPAITVSAVVLPGIPCSGAWCSPRLRRATGQGQHRAADLQCHAGGLSAGYGAEYGRDTGFSKLFSLSSSTQVSSSGGSDGSSNGGSGSLVGVSVSFDMSKTRSHSEQEQSTVLGSMATAGNRLSIVARGDHPGLADDGSISAIAAQLAAKNNIDLEAGWNRQSALNHTTQKGLSVGVEASVGTSGVGFSLSASG